MRFRHPDGTVVHLAYCTNVHPAEDLDGVLGQLARYGEPIRERLGVDVLGLGLWLARDVATVLAADDTALARLRADLAARGLEVVTLNGFPYRGFHEPVVKHAVYVPDWSDPARTGYTLDLARILARLLPDDLPGDAPGSPGNAPNHAARGSVSTLPLGWRRPWPADRQAAASANLDDLADGLAKLATAEGRAVRVGFEPEPGCVIETTEDAVARLSGVDTEWLGVCLDTCHLAVAFEEPRAALDRLARAGLPMVKLQASCALSAANPSEDATRTALQSYAEPRFLHQTREPTGHGMHAADDLDEALTGPRALPGHRPWRVHFHVPLHAEVRPPLATTRPTLVHVLNLAFGGERAMTDHIEVETYTWSVLEAAGGGLVEGIAAELDWTRRQLLALGLTEV